MRAQYELTKRFTAESSIRAFLVAHPATTLTRLHLWARDPNPHVRRLVSEGTRPRLPWAPRLRAFQADPSPVLELLELLKDDPERYVQRSVANNLNDIGKDHPDLAAAVCERWTKDAPPGRRWIVQHALRHLIKRGHRGALETLGVGARPKIAIDRVRVAPKRVDLGGEVRFSFRIASTAPKPQDLMIDYAVHYVKANGAPRPKVFKLKRVTLPAGDEVELSGKISLVDLTTRRHHPGKHGVDVVVNGVTHPLAAFDVRG
jgi:3-methyladenine DNA glycosylase AlkC